MVHVRGSLVEIRHQKVYEDHSTNQPINLIAFETLLLFNSYHEE